MAVIIIKYVLVILLLLYYYSSQSQTKVQHNTISGKKILINKWWLQDFSGADGQGATSTYGFFDSNADPRNGINTVDETHGFVNTTFDIFFRRYNQRPIWLNLQKPFVITAIFGYENQSTGKGDTIEIFTHDSINTPQFIRANLKGRNDYLTRAISDGRPNGWQLIWKGNDTTQFILMNFHFNQYILPYYDQTQGGFKDFIFYGYELKDGKADTRFNLATEKDLTSWEKQRATIGDLSGCNFTNLFPPQFFMHYKNLRMYGEQTFWFTGGRYPNNIFHLQPQRDSSSISWHDSIAMSLHKNRSIYYAITGANSYVAAQQFAKRVRIDDIAGPFTWMKVNDTAQYAQPSTKYRRVDSVGQDPADPFNYKTFANNLYAWVAYYGGNSLADIRNIRTKGAQRKGLRINTAIEPGNEDDAKFLSLYLTPVEKAAMMVAVYDGWEGRMGSNFGVKNADPTIQVKLPAFVGWNYKHQIATMIACKIFYGKNKLPFDEVAGHIYTAHVKYNTTYTADQLFVNGYLVHPEANGYPDDIDTMTRAIRRAANANVAIDINEYGYDKTYVRPTSVNGPYPNIFNQTLYGLPKNDKGLDSTRWQAVLLTRTTAVLASSAVNKSAMFMHTDDMKPLQKGTAPYARSGEIYYYGFGVAPDYTIDSAEIYPAHYYYQRDFLGRWKNYKVVETIDKTPGGRWVLKCQHVTAPDSIMYMIWKADTLEKTGRVTYTIDVKNASGKIFEFIPSYTIKPASIKTLTPINNRITISAGIEPRFAVFMRK